MKVCTKGGGHVDRERESESLSESESESESERHSDSDEWQCARREGDMSIARHSDGVRGHERGECTCIHTYIHHSQTYMQAHEGVKSVHTYIHTIHAYIHTNILHASILAR